MTDAQIFALLRPHIMLVSGVPELILAPQNQNAPKGEYGTLQIRFRDDERGQANIYRKNVPDQKVEFDVRTQRVMTCVCEFFRGNALEYAERLQQMNRREDVVWPLFKSGISIRSVGPIMNLTALQSSNFENRARLEFVLWMEGSSKYQVNNILAVKVEAQNEQGVTLANAEIRVN